jgi:hypothetical protein
MIMYKRKSDFFICRVDTRSVNDMELLNIIRGAVKSLNRVSKGNQQMRVVVRGRKPLVKMENPGGHFYRASKGLVGFDRGGNIVGGIANASELDVYIYRRN